MSSSKRDVTHSATKKLLAFVALISLVGLCLEVTLTRIFSLLYLYHFTYLVLAIAFLGASSAGVIAFLAFRRLERFGTSRALGLLATLLALSVILTLPVLLSWSFATSLDTGDITGLILPFGAIILPFFLISFCLCLVFAQYAEQIAWVYGIDLLGAALGAFLYPVAIGVLGGGGTILACAAIAAVAGLALSSESTGTRAKLELGFRVIGAVFALTALVGGLTAGWWEVEPRTRRYGVEDAELERRWNAFSSVGVYSMAGEDDDFFVMIDSVCGTELFNFAAGEVPAQYAQPSLFTIPLYLTEEKRSILILGAGAGPDVVKAYALGFDDVTGVEINPDVVDLAIEGDYSPGLGWLLTEVDGVSLERDEARSYLASSGRRYQVIQIPWIESRAALMSESLAFSENLLFTTEAFRLYLDHLADDGLLIIHRHIVADTLPEHMLRLISMLVEVTEQEDLSQHIFVAAVPGSSEQHGLLLYSRRPLDEAFGTRLVEETLRRGYTVEYVPEGGDNRFLVAALSSPEDLQSMLATATSDLYPPTDDHPFFFRFARAFSMDSTNRRVIATLSAVLVLTLLFVGIPLLTAKRKSLFHRSNWAMLLYFGAIGYGFMVVEITLIQKLLPLVGRPEIAIVVTLAVLLLTSGIGSMLTNWLRQKRWAQLRYCAAALALLVGVFSLTAPHVVSIIEGVPFAVRALISCLLVAPFGLLMGGFFPRAVAVLEQRDRSLIPWAWAINGLASVLGSAAALFLALNMSISVAMVSGALAYLAIWLVAPDESAETSS